MTLRVAFYPDFLLLSKKQRRRHVDSQTNLARCVHLVKQNYYTDRISLL